MWAMLGAMRCHVSPRFTGWRHYVGLSCCALALGGVLASARPAGANYRDPVLTLTESSREDLAAARGQDGAVLEDADRGDRVVAVVKLSAPQSFRGGTGVSLTLTAEITFSSERGGTATAKLRSNWSGIAMLRTPDNESFPEEGIIDTAEFTLPPGGSETRTLSVGVQFAPSPGWSDENGSAVYLVGRTAGQWDSGGGGPANPRYQALLHRYSEGRVSLGGGFDLDFGVGSASRYDHVNYSYEGRAEYYDEEQTVAQPPPPPPTPPAPPKPDPAEADRARREADTARAADLKRYWEFFGRLFGSDLDLQDATLKLRLYGLAAEQLRARIAQLKLAEKNPSLYEVAREEAAEGIGTLEEQLAAILKAQDELIAQSLTVYRALLEEAGVGEHNALSDYVREGYANYRRELEDRLERMELELCFSAGRRERFEALAQDMIGRHVQPVAVYRLQAADVINRGQPRVALYALHKGLAIDPEDDQTKALLWQLEDGYLRALSARAAGRPAELRARLQKALGEHGGAGWFNAIKDVLTTGITTSVSAIGGKPESLTDLAVTQTDEAVVEHAGLELILSLRYHGLSLEDIANLDQDHLWVVLLDRYHIDPAQYNKHDDGLRMRKAIQAALQDPDVQRLMHPSREQFDIESGAQDDGLDRSWQDTIGDAVNVANTLMLLGPQATIGTPGRAARLVRSATAEAPEVYTVSDGLALYLRLDEVSIALGKTHAGRAALKQLLLFDQNAGIVSKLIAQTMVKQGLIQGADALGGQPAKVAMQVLTALGLGDMRAAARLLRSQGLTEKNIETLLVQLQKAAADTVKVRVPLAPTIKMAQQAAGATVKIGPQEAEALRVSARDLATRAKQTVKIVAAGPSDSPAIVEANQQRLLQEALEEAAEGRSESAKAGLAMLSDLQQRAAAQAQETAKQVAVGQQLAAELQALPAPPAPTAAAPAAVDAKTLAEVAEEPPRPVFTGLIVDCRGLQMGRAMLPGLVDQDGLILYGGNEESEAGRQAAIERGLVAYCSSLEEARQSDRSGPRPLVVQAVAGTVRVGGRYTYAVVSDEEGKHILQEEAAGHFLSGWRVCFVID